MAPRDEDSGDMTPRDGELAPEPERCLTPRDNDSGEMTPRDDDSGDTPSRDDDSGEDGEDDASNFDFENIRRSDHSTDGFSSAAVNISPVDKVRGIDVRVDLVLVGFSSTTVNISPVDKGRTMDTRVDLVCSPERP
jgi:hypothetical protein